MQNTTYLDCLQNTYFHMAIRFYNIVKIIITLCRSLEEIREFHAALIEELERCEAIYISSFIEIDYQAPI